MDRNYPTAGCDRLKKTVQAPCYTLDNRTNVISELMQNMTDAKEIGDGLLVCDMLQGDMKLVVWHLKRNRAFGSTCSGSTIQSFARVVATNYCLVPCWNVSWNN